jgi:hypothetical protein
MKFENSIGIDISPMISFRQSICSTTEAVTNQHLAFEVSWVAPVDTLFALIPRIIDIGA